MENKSFGYVIIAIMILAGSLVIGAIKIKNKEILEIVYIEDKITYGITVRKSGIIDIDILNCSDTWCFGESRKNKYTKEETKSLYNYIISFEKHFTEYNGINNSSYVIYINDYEKALYEGKIEDDIMLRDKLRRLLNNH